jgi:hypothetical protein
MLPTLEGLNCASGVHIATVHRGFFSRLHFTSQCTKEDYGRVGYVIHSIINNMIYSNSTDESIIFAQWLAILAWDLSI